MTCCLELDAPSGARVRVLTRVEPSGLVLEPIELVLEPIELVLGTSRLHAARGSARRRGEQLQPLETRSWPPVASPRKVDTWCGTTCHLFPARGVILRMRSSGPEEILFRDREVDACVCMLYKFSDPRLPTVRRLHQSPGAWCLESAN
jgi:hypothetical protein